MSDNVELSFDDACRLVGKFLYCFGRMERALDSAIAKVLELDDVKLSVVVANLDFAKKIAIVQAAIVEQFAIDQSTEKAVSILNRILGFNSSERVLVAHCIFETTGKSVVLSKSKAGEKGIKSQGQTWTTDDFEKHFARMLEFETELNRITENLSPFSPSLDFSDKRNSMYLSLF
jgi:hypothetical protein